MEIGPTIGLILYATVFIFIGVCLKHYVGVDNKPKTPLFGIKRGDWVEVESHLGIKISGEVTGWNCHSSGTLIGVELGNGELVAYDEMYVKKVKNAQSS